MKFLNVNKKFHGTIGAWKFPERKNWKRWPKDLKIHPSWLFWGRDIEVKYNEAPSLTKSMQSALEELSLEHLWVVYPGNKFYPLAKNVSALPLQKIDSIADHL